MNAAIKMTIDNSKTWQELTSELGNELSAEANHRDANNEFAFENYALLREQGLFKIAIPADLGGGPRRLIATGWDETSH